MKFIKNNDIVSISATSENENYQIENVLNDSPKKRWISEYYTTQTINIRAAVNSDTIAFFNVSGIQSINITSDEPQTFEWASPTSWGSPVTWGELVDPNINITLNFNENNVQEWAEFPIPLPNATDINLTIINTSLEYPSIGIIACGERFECEDPSPEWSYEFIDYSIITELSNGAFDTRDRDVVRSFSGNTFMDFETEFFIFSKLIRNSIKSNPRAWFFASNDADPEYIIYGRFSNMPTTTMTSLREKGAQVDISLIEVV